MGYCKAKRTVTYVLDAKDKTFGIEVTVRKNQFWKIISINSNLAIITRHGITLRIPREDFEVNWNARNINH